MHRKDDLAPVSSILYQKFDMGFGSNGSLEIKFQIRFPLTVASWTESDPLQSLTRNISKASETSCFSVSMQDDVFRSHWSNFEGMLKHPFLKIWRQVSRWNAPQLGPVFFPILFQVSCPWHFKPWHYIRGEHWPQSWVTMMGVFFYRRALKCLEHTGNLGNKTWKKSLTCSLRFLGDFAAKQNPEMTLPESEPGTSEIQRESDSQ